MVQIYIVVKEYQMVDSAIAGFCEDKEDAQRYADILNKFTEHKSFTVMTVDSLI
jgi:hypothetical protein